MKYVSTRGEARRRGFCEILLEGLAPDGGLYLPERYPQVDAATLAAWRKLLVPRAGVRAHVALHRRHRAARPARAGRAQLHRRAVRRRARSCRCARSSPACSSSACPTARRSPSRTWRCSSSATLFEYELARRGRTLNVLGATSGDTGSAAEYAMRGKHGVQVFMLSPHGRMSPFQQAQMFSLQDANIHNIAIEGVFDDCQDIVKAVSADLAFKERHAIGTVNSINWARAARAGRLLLRRLLPGDRARRRGGRLRRADRQFRQHLRRPRRAHDGAADPPPGAGDQRERRPRRVLPHRHLPRAQRRRDARDVEPVDGHLEGVATSSASCSTCSAATRRARARSSPKSRRGARSRSTPAERERVAGFGFVSGRSTSADRLATIRDTCTSGSAR